MTIFCKMGVIVVGFSLVGYENTFFINVLGTLMVNRLLLALF